jgi:hypothetical protein
MIEFLCPNGDRIRCQSEHAGRAAKCPRCGVAFRVPDAAELAMPETAGTDSTVSHPDFTDSGNVGHVPPPMGVGTSMATPFARLWHMRRQGTNVELHLRDGETLIPDQFFESFSQPTHGVFAVREADGSTSLVVVAWESVVRATLRGLSELPPELTP